MLKSNSKKAVENIRAYIVKNAGTWAEERADYNGQPAPVDFPGVAAAVWGAFLEEYRPADYIRRGWARTWQEAFIAYGQGLPCGALFDFLLCAARADLASILEETPEEAARYSEEQAEEVLARLIFREVSKAARA